MFNPIEVFTNTAFIISSIALALFIFWVGAAVTHASYERMVNRRKAAAAKRVILAYEDFVDELMKKTNELVEAHNNAGHTMDTFDEGNFPMCSKCGLTKVVR